MKLSNYDDLGANDAERTATLWALAAKTKLHVQVKHNGISAIIDSYGRIRAQLGLGETGIVDGALPSAIDAPLFTQMRSIFLILMLVFLGGIAVAGRHFD